VTYIAVDSDIDLFIHIIGTHNGMSHAKIVQIHVHRADGAFRICSRCRRVKTVVCGQRNTRVDPTQATCIDHFPLLMIAFINYVRHRKLFSTETNMLVMLREITTACCVITGFCREVNQNCALLSCYVAGSDNFLPTFRGNLSAMFREIAAARCVI
jgi:hypothetical protein